MTYNASIPQSGDFLSSSQAQILTNFGQLNTVFGIDHKRFDDGTAANRGKHLALHMIDNVVDATTASGEMGFYNKGNDLFYRGQSNGTVTPITGGGLPTPIRAWASCQFAAAGGGGAFSVLTSNNITSIVGAAGIYTVTFTNAFPTANYALIAGGCTVGASFNPVLALFWSGTGTTVKTTTQCTVVFQQGSSLVSSNGGAVALTLGLAFVGG